MIPQGNARFGGDSRSRRPEIPGIHRAATFIGHRSSRALIDDSRGRQCPFIRHKRTQNEDDGKGEEIFKKDEDREDQAHSNPDFRLSFEKLSQIACQLEKTGIPVNALHIAGRLGVSTETLVETPAWKWAINRGEVEP